MATPSTLVAIRDVYNSVPFGWRLICHSLVVASWFRQDFLRQRWLLSYWTGFLAAFGGGLLSAFLLQDPKKFGISLFTDNTLGVTWTICWWLMNYCPFDAVNRVHSFLPVRVLTKAAMNSLRGAVMANRVDVAVRLFPGVVAAPLVLGTVAGSGGRLCVDLILHLYGNLTGPAEISEPAFALRSGMLSALVHYLTVHVFKVMSSAEGEALIVTALVTHGVASDLLGRPLDFTQPAAQLLHALSLVPMPGAPPKQRKAISASTSKSSAKPAQSVKLDTKKVK